MTADRTDTGQAPHALTALKRAADEAAAQLRSARQACAAAQARCYGASLFEARWREPVEPPQRTQAPDEVGVRLSAERLTAESELVAAQTTLAEARAQLDHAVQRYRAAKQDSTRHEC